MLQITEAPLFLKEEKTPTHRLRWSETVSEEITLEVKQVHASITSYIILSHSSRIQLLRSAHNLSLCTKMAVNSSIKQ